MKGVLPALAVVAIAWIVATIAGGIYLYLGVGETETVIRSVREREILKAINEMEWIKRIMPQVLEYSFYQSNYFLDSRGGYFDPNTVASYNCIPYWRIYDETHYPPDVEGNLSKALIKYMNEYAAAFGIILPDYEVSYQQGDGTIVNITSNDKLEVERGIAKVEDEADFTGKFDINPFQIFETGKTEFVDEDSILPAIENALGVPCEEQKDKIAEELEKLETGEISIDYEDIQVDCEGHASVKVLVTITGTGEYPVYDYDEKTTDLRSMRLKFYVVTGNDNLIDAENTGC